MRNNFNVNENDEKHKYLDGKIASYIEYLNNDELSYIRREIMLKIICLESESQRCGAEKESYSIISYKEIKKHELDSLLEVIKIVDCEIKKRKSKLNKLRELI